MKRSRDHPLPDPVSVDSLTLVQDPFDGKARAVMPNEILFCSRWDTNLPKSDTKGHQGTSEWCPTYLWSKVGPVERSERDLQRLSGRKIRSRPQKRTRSHSAILTGYGIILSASLQSRKGGDTACVRGPLETQKSSILVRNRKVAENHTRHSSLRARLHHSIGERSRSRFFFSRASLVQLWFLRVRPIAAMASAGRGMRVVYDKEGIDPCSGYAHYRIGLYQR